MKKGKHKKMQQLNIYGNEFHEAPEINDLEVNWKSTKCLLVSVFSYERINDIIISEVKQVEKRIPDDMILYGVMLNAYTYQFCFIRKFDE